MKTEIKMKKLLLIPLKLKMDSSKWYGWESPFVTYRLISTDHATTSRARFVSLLNPLQCEAKPLRALEVVVSALNHSTMGAAIDIDEFCLGANLKVSIQEYRSMVYSCPICQRDYTACKQSCHLRTLTRSRHVFFHLNTVPLTHPINLRLFWRHRVVLFPSCPAVQIPVNPFLLNINNWWEFSNVF